MVVDIQSNGRAIPKEYTSNPGLGHTVEHLPILHQLELFQQPGPASYRQIGEADSTRFLLVVSKKTS